MNYLSSYTEILNLIEQHIVKLKIKTDQLSIKAAGTLFAITLYHAQGIKFCLVNSAYPSAFDSFVTAVFKRQAIEYNVSGNGKLNGKLNPELRYIAKHPGIQANDIASNLKRLVDTIHKQIRTLIKKELIERRGSRKTGGCFLKGK